MKDLRQTPQYVKFMKKRGWVAEKVDADLKNFFIYAYLRKVPFLPFYVMKIQRFSFIPDFKKINFLCKKYKVIFASLEPGIISELDQENLDRLLIIHKYKKKSVPFVPSKTIQIDLNTNKAELFSQMKWVARANIRKAQKKCMTKIFNWNDKQLDNYYDFWKKYGKGYIPSKLEFEMLLKSFKKRAFISICLIKNRFCSGIVVLTTGDIAYYYYAVISEIGKKNFAGELTVWRALKEAKKRGCKLFDFEGIYDERYPQLKRWKGFSQFKSKFGGQEIDYPPAFEKYCFPF